MADRYWVGGTGPWNTASTANWSATSGGASGASVPTAADSVFFDQAGTYTVTFGNATIPCLDITVSAGTVTFAGTPTGVTISGSMSLIAGTVWSASGNITFAGTGTKTITTNGVILPGNPLNLNTGTYNLGSSLTVSNNIAGNGTLNTNNYNFTFGGMFGSGTMNWGSSTVTATGSNVFNGSFTLNAGTSQLNCTSLIGTVNLTSAGMNPLTFYNVQFTHTATITRTINNANTFNNLTFTGPASAGVTTVTFSANQTINGTLSTTGTAGNRRVFFASATYGIGYTLTVNSAPSLTDADFRDLYVIGTAAPISGTRIGNRGNCSGITFSTPKTVYWNLAAGGGWTANAWATSSGGSVSTDNFPLPQDTATIVNTGLNTSATITLDSNITYIGSVDMSLRTNAMTLSLLNGYTIYGDWKNGSGVSFINTAIQTFSGGTTQTINSAGKTFSGPITVDTYGGTVQLADALNIGTNTLTVTNGTFNTAGYAVTCGVLSSANSNVRTINLGASTVTISFSGGATVLSLATTTNLTFNAGTSSITCGASGTQTMNIGNTAGPALAFYDFTVSGASSAPTLGFNTITFNNFTVNPPASTGIRALSIGGNMTVNGTLTCAGASAVRRVFLQSDTIGTQRTLTAAAISADNCDFRDIVLAGAAAGASPTRAGDCGNNLGITFPSPKTVYWNLAGSFGWSATAWCTASGGTPDINNFPLAQDIAVFDNAGAAGTIINNANWNIGTLDASNRTSAMTYNLNGVSVQIYGDFKFGSGVTSNIISGAFVFSKNGTQTITSNGVQFGSGVTINNPNAYVQLADALSLNSARTLTLTSGTFDAVTYNVTIGSFLNSGGAANILKMGSGTWTLSGTGTVWDLNLVPTLIVGTSTIVLSDTSTTARTFNTGGRYYNKLTIGGATGTSVLTIIGAPIIGELASTKTVAHTILLSSSLTTNIGKWSVTGTAGNVVTVGPTTAATTYTININGPANTGIDYLSVSYCAVSTTSPGELYVGANSTNTAGNTGAIIFTATPSPRTLYWRGGTGNWSATTSWATTSGGAGPAAIPTSLDTVTFDSLSNATAYTATIDAGVTIARCAAFTMAGPLTGNVTFAGTVPIAYHGNVSFAATGITRTYTGAMNWTGNGSYTFTTNGLVLSSSCTVNGIGSTWTLGSAFNPAVSNITVNYGEFNTSASNYSVAVVSILSSNANIRSVSLNGSSVTLSGGGSSIVFSTSTNLTFNAGTSSISCSGAGPGFSGGGQTFYNVSFTNAAATTNAFSGANTFNNLTFTGLTSVGINAVTFSANQTINGTLTLGAGTAAAYRTFLASDTIGTPRTLTVNALAAGAADIDFRDIVVTGAAAPLTGTRFGDCKGNNNITFPAAKTVYYRATGANTWATSGAGNWSATSGGAADATMFPLAQDTAVFPSATYPASGITTTIANNHNIGTIDMSLRTSNTMTLATGTTTPIIYGNWINGTGTTLSGTGQMTFAGRGSQTITSAGKTFPIAPVINTPSGSVTLQDAFTTTTGNTIHTAGTFDANIYNVTMVSTVSQNSNIRTLSVGSGTWSLTGGSPWNASPSTNLTVTGTGTISLTSASAKTFAGGGISYSGITLNQGGLGTLSITGNNTFANITDTVAGANTISLGATTQTVGAFTAAGTAGNLLTITGASAGSPATLIYSGSGVISTVDYVVPTFVRAYPTTSTWFAGANSTNGGSLGWIFAASGGVVYAVYITESATALDSISALLPVTGAISESTTALDSVAALAAFHSTAAETARATDSIASNATLGSAVSETVNAADATSSNATMGSAVSDSVTVTDSAAAKQTFLTNISDTVNAADTTASLLVFLGSISEQATAQDVAAAAQSFASSVSDTAIATDSVASIATLGSVVSETVNATDVISSNATMGSAVTDTVNASDTTAGDKNLRGFIVERVTAQDTAAAAQLFDARSSESATAQDTVATTFQVGSAVSESATASDANTAKALFGANVANTVNVSDSASTQASFGGAVSETARALDSVQSNAAFGSQVADSVQVSDAPSAAATFKSQFSATVQVQDAASSSQGFGSSVAESATASETVSSLRSLPGSISESATVQESVVAKAIFQGIIDEVVRGSDQFSTSVVFLAAFSEFAQAYAESVGYLTGSRSVSESSTASDATAATKTLPGSISESATGADQSAASLIWAVYISEQAAGLDSLNAPNSTYNATVANTVGALDTPSTNAIFYAAVIAYAGITDIATARYLWELIDDSQTANWVDVSSAQSAAWSLIDDSQGGTWVLVNNAQTTDWSVVDDSAPTTWQNVNTLS